MEASLILAERIIEVIRESGATKVEAYSALEVAQKILPAVAGMTFNGEPEAAMPVMAED